MTMIGTFARSPDGRFQGVIHTLTLNVKGVEIRPVEPTADNAPDHRIFVGETELGAAWTVKREGKRPCLSVRIDDPSLPTALCGLLIEAEGHHDLHWSRRQRA